MQLSYSVNGPCVYFLPDNPLVVKRSCWLQCYKMQIGLCHTTAGKEAREGDLFVESFLCDWRTLGVLFLNYLVAYHHRSGKML